MDVKGQIILKGLCGILEFSHKTEWTKECFETSLNLIWFKNYVSDVAGGHVGVRWTLKR